MGWDGDVVFLDTLCKIGMHMYFVYVCGIRKVS
jgi:hypothetical protein